jgi:hypothetical protein
LWLWIAIGPLAADPDTAPLPGDAETTVAR